MKKKRRSHIQKLGLPPGTLIHTGEPRIKHPRLSLFCYDADHLEENSPQQTTDFSLGIAEGQTLWLNVHGLHDTSLMSELGHRFNLHPLVLEDILNTEQRPKLDTYDGYLFFVTRFFHYDPKTMEISSEQISLILGHNFVLTFQERPTGSFEPIRERLRANKGQLRRSGADYLAYALLDMIVDRYFIVLEQISDHCEMLEDELLRKPSSGVLQGIHKLKRETMELRRAVWPLREVLNALIRNESGLFQHGTLLYLRDVYDHTVHFIESLESLRDLLAGMLDIYLSTISNRVNMEVRALTVMAMLFMPATLIAGIFGMNFTQMPLLHNPDGFLIAMTMMATIALVMGLIFWRRQWLSRRT
jgi:magnesium transporter